MKLELEGGMELLNFFFFKQTITHSLLCLSRGSVSSDVQRTFVTLQFVNPMTQNSSIWFKNVKVLKNIR
jgi:hypothetical protein